VQKRNTWEDYQYWGHNITKEELAHLQRCAYYNQPQARAIARELMAKDGHDVDKLDSNLFRVRCCCLLFYNIRNFFISSI
jgi:hypothetical protein